MENRGNRASEELASAKKEFRSFRSSTRSGRNVENAPVAAPEISIAVEKDVFFPGDFLACEYNVRLKTGHDVQAIETSVVWMTEGKGEEDIGVHFFERRQKRSGALTSETFQHPQRISTVLPASPFSYEGMALSVRWCVRVRLFMADGEQYTEDKFFRLGDVQPFPQASAE